MSAELGADSIHKGAIAADRVGARRDRLHARHLRALWRLCEHRAGGERVPDPRHHGDVQCDADIAGIAGFVLTIGAAVDANVLINERIREEIRRGRRLIDAVETGYHEAFRAIFDANVTHVISAGIMAYFGSGPVRGFAVVLLIGVVTSVFTAVYFTRMLVALWIRRARPRELHI